MSTPDITPAQVVSTLLGFIGLLVSQGAVTNGTGKLLGGVASIVIPAAWQLADAIIRHGRAHNVGNISAVKPARARRRPKRLPE